MANKDSVTFSNFTGVVNTTSEERLKPTEQFRAVNVDIDDAGQIHRRRGATKVGNGRFHSLFSTVARSFVVKDGSLCLLKNNYTTQVLKTGVGDEPIAYVEVGEDVYFSSEDVSGRIDRDNVIQPWGETTSGGQWLSPVIHPTQSLPEVRGKLLGKPPMASALAWFNGRIYLAADELLWATELYLYNVVDKTRNFLQFESPITGVGVVTDGMYVGTTDGVFFLSGPLAQMQRIPVMDAGMVKGSVVELPADLVGVEDNRSKNAVLFLTKSGLCAGFDSGVCYNLTQSKTVFPESDRAAALFRRQDGMNQYIGVTDSGGTPASAARIGDYVDVEIRRFKGA